MSGLVLVTGAGGFVGSAVVRCLVNALQSGPLRFPDGTPVDHVVALLRPGGSQDRLDELAQLPHWSIEYADLMNRPQTSLLLDRLRPKAIVHCAIVPAAYVTTSDLERRQFSVGILETLFDALVPTPGARFIHTSSAWVLAASQPDDGADSGMLRAYARTKALEEQALPAMCTGVRWISLRLFNLFGKYEPSSRLLPYLVFALTAGRPARLSDGAQVRDFTDVEVAAGAYLRALLAGDEACEAIYDIGSGQGTTVRGFAMMVASVTGNAHLVRFGAARTPDQRLPGLVANPTRAQAALGWPPPTDLDSQVRRAVRWWLQRSGSRRSTP